MISSSPATAVGVLASGGLDSAILVGHLLKEGRHVQPFYIRSNLFWEPTEQAVLARYLAAIASPRLEPLVTLALPLDDLYQGHWSFTGRGVPDADTPDEAVYLPGRNALLIVKAALWCQMHGIGQLALAPLGNNPFADASNEFFTSLQAALNQMGQRELEILRPFAEMNKRQVMLLADGLPLELTFSCIAPRDRLHCGRCNKCAERQAAFRAADRLDPTPYSSDPQPDASTAPVAP